MTSQDNLPENSSSHLPNNSPEESSDSFIKLDQFLKWAGAVQTGGEAKLLIQSGEVKVNGKLEMRRGRKLVEGDRIAVMGERFIVHLAELKSRD